MEFYTENIFSYTNYRLFLKETFDTVQKKDCKLSYRKLSLLLGFKSHTFLQYIIKGTRNLTESSIEKFTTAMNMKSSESKFFTTLVLYNQAKDEHSKEIFYKELMRLKSLSSFHSPSEKQYKYFENWYYSVIKEFIEANGWDNNYQELTNIIIPSISIRQVKEAIKTLLEIGLISQENGQYSSKHKIIDAEHVPVFLKAKGRQQLLENGITLLKELPPTQRFCHYATIAMTKDTYSECIEMYNEFVTELYDYITANSSDTEKDIYNLAFQIFPGTTKFNT